MKYLKLFGNHVDYEGYVIQDGVLRPNVSHCVDQKCVHYNPKERIVSAVIKTSDFEKITRGNGEGYIQYSSVGTSTGGDSLCQFFTSHLFYYKNFNLIQRENGVNISEFLYDMNMVTMLLVTYSQDEYEAAKMTDSQMTVLLSQDGSLVSAAIYSTRMGLTEVTEMSYFNENGECIVDENTSECMVYNGKYDLHVTYSANLINPGVNAVLQRYTILQDDGIPLPSNYFKICFNEEDFLDGSHDFSLWLDLDGTIRGVKEHGQPIKDGDNYVTEDVIPRYDENGNPMYDSQDNPIFYNDKYIVKTPVDDVPFSSIRIDGEKIDLYKLVLDDRGFYMFEEGEHSIEYVLKNRKEIPAYSFHSCVALEEVKIPKKITKINLGAFANCPLLGTDENTIMRICSVDSEPIVVEAEFDFEEGEEKILQGGSDGIFYYPLEEINEPIKKGGEKKESESQPSFNLANYYVINNGVVADVDCTMYSDSGDIKK